MANRFISILFVFLFSALSSAVPAFGAGDDTVVARVNGEPITLAEVEEARLLLPLEMQAMSLGEIMPIVREAIIDTRIAAAQARLMGIEREQEYKLRVKRLSGQVLERILLAREIRAKVSESEIEERYNKAVAFYEGSEEVRARHILLASETEARDIIAQLEAGGDFIKLAKANSIGPSAPGGGDLGWFLKGRMVPAFEKAVFALEPGAYTAVPVQTPFGWHIIRLEDRREPRIPTFAEARENLLRERSAEIVQALKAALRKDATIERYSITGEIETPVASPAETQ